MDLDDAGNQQLTGATPNENENTETVSGVFTSVSFEEKNFLHCAPLLFSEAVDPMGKDEMKEDRHIQIQALPKTTVNIDTTTQDEYRTEREEKKKLEALYEEFTERIKTILLDATPPLLQKTQSEDQGTELRLTPSLECMIKKRQVCAAENGECGADVCESCAALTTEGQWGHFPWDELEMMKHGWMDTHGQHWGNIEPRDDVTLLQLGVLDREGHQTNEEMSTAGHILRRKMSTDEMRQLMSGKVQFGGVTFSSIPDASGDEEEEDEESRSLNRVPSQTLITLCDVEDQPEVSFDCYNVRGGEVTRVETAKKKASLLKCPDRLVYVERGGEEEILVAAEINKDTGRFATKRLQKNP